MEKSLSVRAARHADIPAIDALLAKSYPRLLAADYPPSVLVTAIPLIARANPALIASGTYYVAEDASGAILGVGGWTAAAPQGRARRGVGNIRHFGTDPDATRRGVGTGLMDHAIAEATAAGMRSLDCMSTRTAVPFYQRHGFIAGEEIALELRPGITFPAISMSRSL